MNREQRAYISLGGNQGGERERFSRALDMLAAVPGVRLLAVSRLYRTEPQGLVDQPWFYNQAAALMCGGLTPLDLLSALLRIETALGRKRTATHRFGPRPIDLDLLLFEDAVCDTPFLTVPHPRLAERAFVLVPLLELDAGLTLPDGRSCAALLAALPYRVSGDHILQRSCTMLFSAPDKILGILGGMGPAASAEFCRLMTIKAPAQIDQHHPVMYMLSDPQIPDRVAGIDGTGEDPAERLKKGLLTLEKWGADYLTVPCNTAHVFIDRFRDQLSRPFIHIVEATISATRAMSPEGAWLLATTGTCRSGLYQSCAKKMGYTFLEVDDAVQQKVQACVVEVKANKMKEAGEAMRAIVEGLWKKRDVPVTTACTELPLAYDASGLPAERSVSSLGALSDACLNILYGDAYRPR